MRKLLMSLIAALALVPMLAACSAKSENAAEPQAQDATILEASTFETHEPGGSPSVPLDGSSDRVHAMMETQDPSTYDVLRDAKDYLTLMIGASGEYDHLFIYGWRIESFDFLAEFEGITSLAIYRCYIPEGVSIPKMEALSEVAEINLNIIYGYGAVDVLSDCLPLPKLDELYISGDVHNKTALPAIPSLTDLTVSVPDALSVIANNTHITGALRFGVPYHDMVYEDIETIAGVEKFSSIQYLRPPHSVRDLSTVAGCANLKILDLEHNAQIDSLAPLYGLEHLQEIIISGKAYGVLPEDERTHFTPDKNGDANAVHTYVDGIAFLGLWDGAEGEHLELREQTIDSFDFLSDYPYLISLIISNCDIAEGLVLPVMGTLEYLHVQDPNALELVKNNTQFAGWLQIGYGDYYFSTDEIITPPIADLSVLEDFASLEYLTISFPVHDISALSGCVNLRKLSIMPTDSVETLIPLYELPRLRYLHIGPAVFRSLPMEEQEHFTSRKNYITSVHFYD